MAKHKRAECFEKEREFPTSSSSSQWSSTSSEVIDEVTCEVKSTPRKLEVVDFRKVILDRNRKN